MLEFLLFVLFFKVSANYLNLKYDTVKQLKNISSINELYF